MSVPEHIIDPTAGPKLFLRSPDGLITKELHLDNDGNLNIQSAQVRDAGSTEIAVSLTDQSRPYIRRTSSSYGTIAYFPFGGSDYLGIPAAVRVLAHGKNSGKNFDIRIVQSDTGDVIAELAGSSNSDVALLDLGTLSNISTGPAIWEIQSKVESGGEVRLSAVSIKF